MSAIALTVNGRSHTVDVVRHALRPCSATISLRGGIRCGSPWRVRRIVEAARPSCVTPVSTVAGAEITT